MTSLSLWCKWTLILLTWTGVSDVSGNYLFRIKLDSWNPSKNITGCRVVSCPEKGICNLDVAALVKAPSLVPSVMLSLTASSLFRKLSSTEPNVVGVRLCAVWTHPRYSTQHISYRFLYRSRCRYCKHTMSSGGFCFQVFDQWFCRGGAPIVTLTRTYLFKRGCHLQFRTFRPCLHEPTSARLLSCLFLLHLRPSNSFHKMVHIGNKHFIWFRLVQNNNGANKWNRWWADQNVTRSKLLIKCGFIHMHYMKDMDQAFVTDLEALVKWRSGF